MTGTARDHPDAAPPVSAPSGPAFWSCLAIGAATMTFGVAGAWGDRADTHVAELAVWLAGAGIVHDFLVAPVVVVAAWLSGFLPRAARTPVRLGLAMSALVTVVFWPTVQGWGRATSVPSALPLDYGRNLVVLLAVVWVVVAVAVALRTRKDS